MGKRYSSAEAAGFVSGFLESGVSCQEYAARCGISKSYLGKLLKQWREGGSEGLSGFVEVAPRVGATINRCHVVEIKLFNGTIIKVECGQ